jgi:uncharacterized protein
MTTHCTLNLTSKLLSLGLVLFMSVGLAHAHTNEPGPPIEGLPVYRALLPKAQAGDAATQTTLGLMRLQGEVVPRDLKIARVWLGKAAMQNHHDAQFYLGQLLMLDVLDADTPNALNQQLTEGLGWLRRAAREHHPQAQLLYAQTVIESQLEQPFGHSKVEARQHLDACATVHLPCTEYALAMLDHGETEHHCPKTELCEQKRNLLYTLANANQATAMFRLSRFEGEDYGFWLRRAARNGHDQASFELAQAALEDELTLLAEDPPVLKLLEQAAMQGHLQAMHTLGTLLHEGTRFPVNRALGLQWLELASQQGHEPSTRFLRSRIKTNQEPNHADNSDSSEQHLEDTQ